MVIDKPIYVTEYSLENRQELIDRVQNVIARNHEERSIARAA